ncbi:ABC transporter substrate-binding protein [Streptacidiphilus jiangxiensis]|uniref:ABC-type branched-chain amino acid transport system, substrate-binding protein n=1 Tax=Streptacidiphilus jiangxiensis TaxID=235985 RepID=A0A1H8AB27_STRJI|nr:ABC transporter substrate-binding protein [Streptacidiphilus jiangxiensis]SEM67134.1 ABC-type branched-chain amino acid transport system, substrate-binding protein [Streptacidiphilus jiangxiensis]
MRRPRHRVERARTARSVLALLTCASLLALATGCGSRLPLKDFENTSTAAPGQGAALPPIPIGIVTSVSSPIGGDTFTGPLYGAQAYFRALNAAGGVNGRQVKVFTCDDSGAGIGNQACVHQLIDSDHVVALVAGSVLDYAGAGYVSSQGVPDIGGITIGTQYDQYPHLYQIYGSDEPRDGKSVGWNGVLYQTTEVYRYFKAKLGLTRAVVVAYNQADSTRYAAQLAQGLKAEGYDVLSETVDFALPNFGSVAAEMKADHAQLLLDAMDTRGNAGLCQAMASAGVTVTAKVTNEQNWSEQVRTDYAATPGCRNALWVTSDARNYEDTAQYPAVAAFRTAMQKYYPDRQAQLSEWELLGWAGAQWFTDAAASCGADVTRSCVDAFMQRKQPYTAHDLIQPSSFVPSANPPSGPQHACLNVARWEDSAGGGKGAWVTQVPDMNTNCFQVPALPYRP